MANIAKRIASAAAITVAAALLELGSAPEALAFNCNPLPGGGWVNYHCGTLASGWGDSSSGSYPAYPNKSKNRMESDHSLYGVYVFFNDNVANGHYAASGYGVVTTTAPARPWVAVCWNHMTIGQNARCDWFTPDI